MTTCLCSYVPRGHICVFCAYEQGFPQKIYAENRVYENSDPIHCDCGRVIRDDHNVWCYRCRLEMAR